MNETPEPKIIVDEDWKTQVQVEKEKLAAAENPPAAEPPPAAAKQQPQLPAPTMALLFSSLATQAMYALGMIADPQAGESKVSLDEARHVIDTLQLLDEKTKGNLTPQERDMLTRLLYDLRMAFVAARDAQTG